MPTDHSAANYYKKWLGQIGFQVRSNIRELAVGLIIALVILILQAHYKAAEIKDFHADLLATVWPYAGAIALYVLYAAIRAPYQMDRVLTYEVENLRDERRALLEDSEKPVIFQFTKVTFRHEQNPAILVYAKVLNRGSALTLHQIRLTTETDSAFSVEPTMNTFTHINIDEIKLDDGEVKTAYLVFKGDDVERDIERHWAVTFFDNRGKPYREPISRELHERYRARPRKEYADHD